MKNKIEKVGLMIFCYDCRNLRFYAQYCTYFVCILSII